MLIQSIIKTAQQERASDIHYEEERPLCLRIDGTMQRIGTAEDVADFPAGIDTYLTDAQKEIYASGQDLDFAIETAEGQRCRVNLFHKMGEMGCVLRLLAEEIPTTEELGLPSLLQDLAMLPRGLVLVTGPTGSGKSTTLASMIDYANRNRQAHIITIEDPVEYRHASQQSLISQREVGRDVPSFAAALRSALREDPDIILVGEMRDHETIAAALTAAETGHLVLSTLHTNGAAKSVDRIVDIFPPHQQGQIRMQLSGTLKGIITQQLLKKKTKGRLAALEIMVSTPGILNMIREGKSHQISSAMQTGGKDGMILMDQALARLVQRGDISLEEAASHCTNRQELDAFLKRA